MRCAANVFRGSPVVLAPGHWQGRDTVDLARGLLGKVLVRRIDGREIRRLISEVEAYDGEGDLACHARAGRTPRTEPMYRAGGCWYVYLCYGVHEMLNLVTGPEGWPAALLIRAVSGTVGPGRVTRALAIDRTLNGRAAEPSSGLHVEDHGLEIPRRSIRATPRVGVAFAGSVWARKRWRFHLEPAGAQRLAATCGVEAGSVSA